MGYRSLLACALVCACGGGGGGDDDGGNGGGAADAAPMASSRVEGYLRSDVYTQLVVEVDSVAGFEPRPAVETDIAATLEQILDKPGGVTVVADGAIASQGGDHAWTDQELFALADQLFDRDVGDDAIKMHAMFVDGHSARDTDSSVILGLAWGNTHIAIFKQTIEEVCAGPLVPPLIREQVCAEAEEAIWVHEIGHVLGLVDNGLPMVEDHRDEEHGRHDVSEDCVMYWAYQSGDVVTKVRDRIMNDGDDLGFGPQCLDDIAAVRDR